MIAHLIKTGAAGPAAPAGIGSHERPAESFTATASVRDLKKNIKENKLRIKKK